MIAGGFVAMLASLPIGWLCFRLRGPYFTIATIATAQVLMLIFLKFRDFAWGAREHDPQSRPCAADDAVRNEGAVLLHRARVTRDCVADNAWIERSRIGYYCVAIGEDEDAAEAIGVDAPGVKRKIFMISAFLTALAGTFYTQYIYFIDPQTAFNFNVSIEAALVSIVGGVGTLWGPVIGTVLLETTSALLQSWLGNSIGGVQLTVYALILMAVILWRPTGIMGYLAEIYARGRTKSLSLPAKA
jgi:branched-chain amino acid transport system permease protein